MRQLKFRVYTEVGNEVLGMKYFDLSDTSQRNDTIMQFTGLKDKNGKEIYEGDIVRMYKDSESWSTYTVEWNHCGFQFMELMEYLPKYEDKEYEIIGNIYENADLLSTQPSQE